MRAFAGTVVSALLLGAALSGCGSGGGEAAPSSKAAPRAVTSSASASPTSKPAPSGAEQAGLTPSQQAGQRVIYSYPGKTVPRSLLRHIRAGEAAGVIFFKENVGSQAQLSKSIQQLNQANEQSPVNKPLLLLTDQEGGEIRRIPGPPDSTAKQSGASEDPAAAAKKAGAAAGANLASVGMNMNAAPVLGVYRQEGNALDKFGRSYSKDPKRVAEAASAFVTGQRAKGVAATAKHFPGLGAAPAGADTDQAPVTLNVPLEQLRGIDEAPYPSAFSAGAELAMPSWATYPALDPKRPAGLSSKVIRDELRGRLGFRGVTVTDALEAKALKPFGSPAQRGLLAAQAGEDLLLASERDVSQGEQVAGALENGLRSGKLDKGENQAAIDRIEKLRSGLKR